MHQPQWLMTDGHCQWNWARGNDCWAVLSASAAGDLPRVQELIARKPNLLRCSEGYRRPIHFAVVWNHLDLTRWLLEQGANPLLNYELLDMTRDRGHDAMLELLTGHCRERWGVRPEGAELGELIREGDVDAVITRLDRQPELVHAADEFGNQPLHWAALTRNIRLIDALLERGAEIDRRRPDGARAVELAFGDYHYRTWYRDGPRAMRSHEAVMGHLLARGAEHDLITAAWLGDIEAIDRLLAEDPAAIGREPDYVTYYSGHPLRVAAQHGRLAVVARLLEAGADPNFVEHDIAPHGGALHAAAGAGHLDIAKLLLDAGADPNAEVESSGNVLTMAEHWHKPDMVALLQQYGALWPEWHCIRKGLTDDFARLLAVKPGLADDPRVFADAAKHRNEPIAAMLLARRPDSWERLETIAGETPEITRWMLDQGMSATTPDWLEATVLHREAEHGRVEQMEVFLDLGTDLEAIDDEYRSTPLGWAARFGQLAAAELLLDHGADPNGAGADWARPLTWARRRGHTAVADRLALAGATEA